MTDRYAVALFEQLYIPRPWVGADVPAIDRGRPIPSHPVAGRRRPPCYNQGRPEPRFSGLYGTCFYWTLPGCGKARIRLERTIAPRRPGRGGRLPRRRAGRHRGDGGEGQGEGPNRRPRVDDAGTGLQPVSGRVRGARGRDGSTCSTCRRSNRLARRRSRSATKTSIRRSTRMESSISRSCCTSSSI